MIPRPALGTAPALAVLLLVLAPGLVTAPAQTILAPWGNLLGLRVADQPVDLEAGLRLVHRDWSGFSGAVKYLQRPRYARTGDTASVESIIEGVRFRTVVRDQGAGKSTLELEWTSHTNLSLAGIHFCLDLPDADFAGGHLRWKEAAGPESEPIPLPSAPPPGDTTPPKLPRATGLRTQSARGILEVDWDAPRSVRLRRDASSHPTSRNDPSVRQFFLPSGTGTPPAGSQVYLELSPGDAIPGQSGRLTLHLSATVTPDPTPARVTVDVTRPGRAFEGVGGNFRLQFPATDPAVIQYHLDHLRPAWGRIELCWEDWDPRENQAPIVAARAGSLHAKVADTLHLARTLARQPMPLMLSAWNPPRWARAPGQPPGVRGTALDMTKLDRICSSLTEYLVFLKEHAGIEAAFLSFNEPETGVEVRQTPLEHAQFLRAMGPHLARAGLTTRLLLGDTAHATRSALEFLGPALADPATHGVIGAIAFHTWRGCTATDLPGWVDAARQLRVPLHITEAGADAHLHEYPAARLEPWFQLQEIELYVRLCALAQPASLIAWQLTTDYSLLRGGGIYDEPGPLQPTQRYWNFAQLDTTPRGAFALPVTTDHPEITAAAFGDLLHGRYALHLVNRGAPRRVLLSGLPAVSTPWRRLTTDTTLGMAASEGPTARDGQAELLLPTASFITLLGGPADRPENR